MNYSVICLGTNLFNRRRNIRYALGKLRELGNVLYVSSIYETEPYGYEHQNTFLNVCVLIGTSYDPWSLLEELKRLEKLMGRKDTFRNAPRVMDMDILLFNELEISTDRLTVPHPGLYERKFFAIPCMEVLSRYPFVELGRDFNFKDGFITLFELPYRFKS